MGNSYARVLYTLSFLLIYQHCTLFVMFGYLNISPASCEYTFKVIRVSISIYHFSKVLIIKIYSLLVVHHLIKGLLDLFVLRRDIESNPGPRRNYSQCLSFCHWNRNSLPSQNYIKLSLLQAFSIVSKFDIISLSKTYLDLSIGIDEKLLSIDGYNLLQADYPSDCKRVRLCLHHKQSLFLHRLST